MPDPSHTFERGKTPANGVALAWTRHRGTEAGGQLVVVLHGLGSSSRDLLYLADHPALAHRPMLFIDAAGHGESDRPSDWSYTMENHADAVAELLGAFDLSSVAFVGHSMGGSIGIALATRHPGRIASLVAAEPNLDPGEGSLSGHIARQSESRFVDRGYRALVYQTQREAERGSTVAARFLVTLKQASPIALHRSAVSLRAERSPDLPRAGGIARDPTHDDPGRADASALTGPARPHHRREGHSRRRACDDDREPGGLR